MKCAAAPELSQQSTHLLANFPSSNHCSIGLNVAPQQLITLPNERGINIWDRILQAMNRNARKGKRANKGKRPCSRIRRRAKKKKIGKP